jgi:hypothetical protein
VAFTVTATEAGSSDIGISLVVKVITGQAASPIGQTAVVHGTTPSLAITPLATGSWIYGSNLGLAGTYTPNGSTTYEANSSGAGLEFISMRSTGTTTASTPVTVGGTATVNSIGVALLEIESGTGLAEDASSPAQAASNTLKTVTTASFTPPSGALLVALAQSNGSTGVCTMGITDTSGLGLTWTEQIKQNATGTGYCGTWTAVLPGGSTPVTPADAAGAVDALAVSAAAPSANTAGAADVLAASVTAPVKDAAGAADALTVAATVPSADVAGAADTLAAAVSAPAGDVAGAAEALVIGIARADVAGAAESMAISTPAGAADAAGAADSLVVTASVPLAESGGAADTAANTTPHPGDAAGAADSLAVTVTAPSADVAGARDALAVTGITAVAGDVAGAADSLAVAAAVPSADVAGAADSLSVSGSGTVSPADAAGAAESMAIAAPAALADAAGAAESVLVNKTLPAADVAGARDALAVTGINVAMHDAGAATDAAAAGVGAGSSTFIGQLPGSAVVGQPGMAVTRNAAGYPGGPSGNASVVPSALGNSWEIYAVSAADYTTVLAVIPTSMLVSFQFVRQLDDIGSGTVILSQDDPWWVTTTLPGGLPSDTLLNEECLWQVWKDGVNRFEFLGETVTEQLVDSSEQRQVTITGPGTIAVLKWAMIAPQGFPDIVLKLDGILDSFDEVDVNGNGVVDTNIWTTVSPSSHVYITPIANLYSYPGGVGYNLGTLFPSGSLTLEASPSGTFLGASPYDATDTLISAQVTPIGVSSTTTDSSTPAAYGTGLNGSELTQLYIQSNYNGQNYAMFGLSASAFYVQLGQGGQVITKVLPAYDSTNHAYWMITEQAGSGGGSGTFYFWTSPDGQTWTQQWTYVHTWDATNVTFYMTATYSVDSTQSAQVTNLNSNVTTPSYQGQLYLGVPLMGVWLDQFSQAQARGTVPMVTSNVTPAADSYGRAWSDSENVQAVNGTDMYSMLQSATVVVNADYVMDPGFQLRVGQPAAGQVALGVDRSGYIILREGYDCSSKSRVRARNQIQTLIGGENADGHEISAYSPTFAEQWGQREGWFQAAVQVDPTSMAYATAASLGQNETEVLSWSVNLTPNLPGRTIFASFDVGDWLGIELPDFSAVNAVRVTGIAVQVDSTGTETHELTLVSYIQWLAEQLTYLANKLGGSFVNSLGTSPVAPSKYGTGQVPTYFEPAATLSGLADVSTNSASSTASGAPMVYNAATGTYQAAGSTDPVSGNAVPSVVSGPDGSTSQSSTQIIVNTGNGSTVVGLQGDGTVTTVDAGGTAPSVPDAPSVAGLVQGLLVTWDGLLSGAAPLSNFLEVQVYVGTASGFTPSSANLVTVLTGMGSVTISGLTAGTTYYVKLASVSTAGAISAPTTGVPGTATGMPTSVLTGQLPASLIGNSAGVALNPNPFFNGGDLTGWFVTNGTLSASAPPAGAPGAAQWSAKVISTSANCLITGSPAPFPVTSGQPYAMTAWVYNPGGSSVNVAVGFNWTAGTVSVAVGPGVWVPVTTVQTCPGGVTSAYQVIGPVASGVTVYVLGAVAAGQVPGQLLVANSVAAAQIAANTITAAQIAANTITASLIAANTITAAQIAASTITATQIAAATITATQIAASTITAAKIAAGTITATQLSASIIVAGIVNGTIITGATFVSDGTSGEFLAYSGTPTSGNLIMSFAAAADTDAYGNGYNAGFWVYGASGSAVGMIPSGSNTALALTPGVTPAAIGGTTLVYGTTSGTMQEIDGVDGQAYGTARRSLVMASPATFTNTTMASFISSTVAAGSSTRYYRIHGKLLFSAAGTATARFALQWIGPSGVGGVITFTWVEGTNSWCTGAMSAGSAGQPGIAASGSTVYPCDVDGLISVPSSTSGSFAFQACWGSGGTTSYVVAANSFIELMPV